MYYLTENDYLIHSRRAGWTKKNHKYLSKYIKNGKTHYRYASSSGRKTYLVNGKLTEFGKNRKSGLSSTGESQNYFRNIQNGGTITRGSLNLDKEAESFIKKGRKFISDILTKIKTLSIRIKQINKPTGTYLKDFLDGFKK